MSHSSDKLIRMAGQMADFFRSQPNQAPAKAVAEHINAFWSPRMRQDLADHIAAGAEADPIVRECIAFVRLPAGT
ncbi:formate dehydrogenase subunit delta [Paracoccus sp. MBLB3053]|uniref:Formate dehydrogenase subunit delta n=1 Tax=Paracoccus aurantius TaxID=3073814 RepID=A0ABU2HLR2_9RHOB|nr:formate dehydrogenase subunit delta [Paracoccus sp. MBLB3053]MDS9465978.1 formate dehydrogenase subunit delta [Paracoccus sp. MBLB3053]